MQINYHERIAILDNNKKKCDWSSLFVYTTSFVDDERRI